MTGANPRNPSSDPHWPRLESLLDEALDLPEDARTALLERVHREDRALGERLDALLRADAAADAFLMGGAALWLPPGTAPATATPLPGGLEPGARVGVYRVVREIGRGGMGIVYLAERADGQFEQRAALKLVRRGLDDEDIARFRRERQILARLEHPSIARLFDGGLLGDGRPYFVMELVDGEPITWYCDGRRLPLDARLRLFVRVCDAVQYAHGNLVVHRDLKPSNILVAAGGLLKLLDFGIAKLLGDPDATDHSDITRSGQRYLTPGYAAPEQLRGDAVSTATDVYALGLILFELLTGQRAFGGDPRPGLLMLERAVLDSEPVRPSVAVRRQTLGRGREELESAARARGTTAAALGRRLSGDLDAIVLKALRQEPERRYPTAAALAADVERYLEGLPVGARPEGRRYRAAKFVRRHRLAIGAAVLLVASLAGGLGIAGWQARARALEARKAEAVKDFLIDIFRGADPVRTGSADVSLREVLDRGAERAAVELTSQPVVQGELLTVLAGIYAELGVVDRAETLAQQARDIHERLGGADSPEVATNLRQQASLAAAKGRAADAERLARRALAIHEQSRGASHPDVAEDLDALVIALRQAGRVAEALPLARQSLAIRQAAFGSTHRLVADSMNNLAVLMREQGRYDEAADLYRDVVTLRRRVLGDGHPHVALTLHNFAALEHFRGRYEASSSMASQAQEIFVRLYGDDHPLTLAARSTRAASARMLGRYDEAEAAFLGILDAWRRTLGEDHPNAIVTAGGLARVYRDRGDLQRAERLLRDIDGRWRARMGADHPIGASIRRQLGAVLAAQGRYEEAGVLLAESLDRMRAVHGAQHPEVADTLHELGVLAYRRGDLGRAAAMLDEALGMRRRLLGERHVLTGETLAALAAVRRVEGDAAAARTLLTQALEILRDALPADHPLVISASGELKRIQEAG